MAGITREYDVAPGVETPSLPSAGTPTANDDLVTKGYADGQYTSQTAFNAHLIDTADAHDASAISVSAISGVTATEVQGAIAEHQGDIETLQTSKISTTEKGAANGVAPLDSGGKVDAPIDASKITTGTIDLARLPASVTERLVIVADQATRYALTTATVQNGDVVKQTDNDQLYLVKDDTNLSSASGYETFSVGSAAAVPWSGVTSKPTTVSGYSISDAVTPSGTQTLTNKTIVAGDNTISGITVGMMSSGATSNGYVPTADGGGNVVWSAQTGGAVALVVASKTTAYTLTTSDDVILCDASGGAFTATLPTAVGNSGKVLKIVKIDTGANAITIATTSSQTIGGRASSAILLRRRGNFIQVVSDGANWEIDAKDEYHVLSATATGTFAAMTNGGYMELAGASLALPYGRWRLRTQYLIVSGTGTAILTYHLTGLYGSAGTNTTTPPSAAPSGVLDNTKFTNVFGSVSAHYQPSASDRDQITLTTLIDVTTTSTYHAVWSGEYASAGNGAVYVNMMAERIW